MTIKIDDQLLISEVQKKFSGIFPFLQLHFFPPASNPLLIFAQPEIPSGKRLVNFKKEEKTGRFTITPKDPVSVVEQNFRDQYAMEVQVLRRSGNTWLMTTKTDDYTLEQQNTLGIEMSTNIPAQEPEDIHEQE